MNAVHFGAGNIGRGFIGKILLDSGISVLFADVSETLVAKLNQLQQYRVRIVSSTTDVTETCTRVQAALLSSPEVQSAILSADLITLSVGVNQLATLAPVLASYLASRQKHAPEKRLNIIACENSVRATSELKRLIFAEWSAELQAWAEERIGFADAAVDRIVLGSSSPPNNIDVTTEPFAEWIVDKTQLKMPFIDVPFLQLTDQLTAYIKRKLFTLNTGHAVAAYLGKQANKPTILAAMKDEKIAATVKQAMLESGAVLCQQHPIFSRTAHEQYIHTILERFKNPELNDSVLRVGRDPIRKLGAKDRLIAPLRGALQANLPYEGLLKGIAAALQFTSPTDPSATQLQEWITERGVVAVFQELSGIEDETVQKELAALCTHKPSAGSAHQLAASN